MQPLVQDPSPILPWIRARKSLLDRYIQHIQGRDAHNTQPWHAVGERLSVVFYGYSYSDGSAQITFAPEPVDRRAMGRGFAHLTRDAQVYLWTHDMLDLAVSAPLPPHTVSPNLLPYSPMFWSLETTFQGPADDLYPERGPFHIDWLLVVNNPYQSTIRIFHPVSWPAFPNHLQIYMFDVPHGARWPDDFPDHQRTVSENVIKAISFLNSPYVTQERGGLPRPLRRELQRKGVPPAEVEDGCNVVTLRRPVPRKPRDNGEEPGTGGLHYHRWWVSGHHRAQWYPSLGAHRVIWIRPFLKGNPQDPLLEKVYKVAR